ncbi:myosin light chain kinase, smooth muscle [Eurytemora carolleeae]|uniref:myosin light chain kinase, smooth muscle n=1 Tax=Eurytemora carolleeae TaxID=1294199 RepID=UPI000C75CB51|nr:myosin light chain kinase, smooth muscle [Eurytemora carolleeae]|eukprot:XP_023344786.1 myosin light chain kinase, smooth muscle-like [Eurytemora affinis]
MNSLHSTKLLQLYDAYDNGRNEMCLIMEYIGGGELFDRVIDEEFVLSERACRVFMKQILEGVQYIHRSSIIHLDLKPENILCINRTGNRIKIIDFGLARRFEPEKKLQILFGTPEFVAPEIVNFEPIGYCTDMWAIGVICYVLVSGLSPFMGDTDLETMANVTIAEFDYEDEAFEKVSDEAKDFIDHLLVREKEKRSTVEESLKHPWILRESDLQRRCSQGSSLISTKENLSQQRAAWSSRDSCYYLFDSKSKTASQLYEANVCISPQLLDTLESSTQDQEQFSFFSTEEEGEAEMSDLKNQDGCSKMVDREENSELESVKDSKLQVKRGDTDRKRGLEENVDLADKSSLAEDSIEYIGLVKRPKTPLITAR